MSEINRAGMLQILRKRKSDLEKERERIPPVVSFKGHTNRINSLRLAEKSAQIALLDELIQEIEK